LPRDNVFAPCEGIVPRWITTLQGTEGHVSPAWRHPGDRTAARRGGCRAPKGTCHPRAGGGLGTKPCGAMPRGTERHVPRERCDGRHDALDLSEARTL